MPKICEACGLAFSCGGYGCWCGRVAITERHMDWIAATFRDCLCPACLRKVSREELGPATNMAHRPSDPGNPQGGASGV
ncbi:cysteine-rich CWC family protein [Nitrospira sp. Nam80]